MSENTTPTTGRILASRIPLFKVQSALRHASATTQARAALRAALTLVPIENLNLRRAIRKAASAAEWGRSAELTFDRFAVGVNHG